MAEASLLRLPLRAEDSYEKRARYYRDDRSENSGTHVRSPWSVGVDGFLSQLPLGQWVRLAVVPSGRVPEVSRDPSNKMRLAHVVSQ